MIMQSFYVFIHIVLNYHKYTLHFWVSVNFPIGYIAVSISNNAQEFIMTPLYNFAIWLFYIVSQLDHERWNHLDNGSVNEYFIMKFYCGILSSQLIHLKLVESNLLRFLSDMFQFSCCQFVEMETKVCWLSFGNLSTIDIMKEVAILLTPRNMYRCRLVGVDFAVHDVTSNLIKGISYVKGYLGLSPCVDMSTAINETADEYL